MSWSDYFIGDNSQSSDEQADNYARLQAEYERRKAARPDTTVTVADFGLANQNAAAWEGAKEGAAEGFNNVLNAPGRAVGAIGDTLGQTLGGILKNIPWWAYLGAAAALFFWMGGLALLRGRLAR